MYSNIKIIRIIKILSITSFLFILFNLYTIFNSTSLKVYEISIYDVFPWYFWIALLVPIVMPIIVLIFIKPANDKLIHYSYYLIIAAFLSLFIFLCLPYLRGYVLYNSGDTLSHFGFVNDILSNGVVGAHNIYPLIHIIISSFILFTNIDFTIISLFIPQLFITIYIIYVFLLSRSLGFSRYVTLFILAFSIIPIYGIELTREFIMPSFDAFCFIPLILFLLIKSRTLNSHIGYTFALMVILLEFSFFHVESALFLLAFLITIILVFSIADIRQKNIFIKKLIIKRNLYLPVFLLFIGFFIWFSSTVMFKGIVLNFYNSIFLGIGVSPSTIAMDTIKATSLSLLDVILYGIKMYSIPLLLFSLTGLLAIKTFIKISLKQSVFFQDFMFSALTIVLAIVTLLLFLKEPLYGLTTRTWKYLLLVSMIFFAAIIANSLYKFNNMLYKIFVSTMVIFILVVAIFTTYPSPIIGLSNRQVTQSTLSAMTFFHDVRSENTITLSVAMNTQSFAQISSIEKFMVSEIALKADVNPPRHFGYNNKSYLGSYYNKEQYLVYNALSKVFYPTIYPNYQNEWKFVPDDYVKLQYDTSIIKIFDNSDVVIYYISYK